MHHVGVALGRPGGHQQRPPGDVVAPVGAHLLRRRAWPCRRGRSTTSPPGRGPAGRRTAPATRPPGRTAAPTPAPPAGSGGARAEGPGWPSGPAPASAGGRSGPAPAPPAPAQAPPLPAPRGRTARWRPPERRPPRPASPARPAHPARPAGQGPGRAPPRVPAGVALPGLSGSPGSTGLPRRGRWAGSPPPGSLPRGRAAPRRRTVLHGTCLSPAPAHPVTPPPPVS